ncbi:MAG: hypothetical protein CM1200mP16_07330 [Nitrospina sp.]|nr:MAG: hypothetical protein CM1200mP16_07330 [Nitrospina sp.]
MGRNYYGSVAGFINPLPLRNFVARGENFNSRKQYVNEEGTLVSKKTFLNYDVVCFRAWNDKANAADIKAVKVSGLFRYKQMILSGLDMVLHSISIRLWIWIPK